MDIEEYLKPYRHQISCKGSAVDENDKIMDLEFNLIQRPDGNLFLAGYLQEISEITRLNLDFQVKELTGTDPDGIQVRLIGNTFLFQSNFAFQDDEAQLLIAGYPSGWEEGYLTGEELTVVFYLANIKVGQDIEYQLDNRTFQLVKAEGYDETIKRLRYTGGVEVTAKLQVSFSHADELEEIIDCVQKQCYLLSLIKGTYVTWLDFSVLTHKSDVVYRRFRNSVTRGYASSELIRSVDAEAIVTYIITAFPKYNEIVDHYMMPSVISRHVEARSGPFVENRALIAAVGIEFLASKLAGQEGRMTYFNQDQFQRGLAELKAKIKSSISEVYPGLDAGFIQGMSEKTSGFNYRGLAGKLRKLNKTFAVGISEEDILLYVDIRNSLAHSGEFPHENSREFYYRKIIHLADRILLRMLDYRGNYSNFEINDIAKM